MGFYRSVLVPRLMTAGMTSQAKYRAAALAEVEPEILEIGFGTGLNLGHYPPQVRRITAVDSNSGIAPGHCAAFGRYTGRAFAMTRGNAG
jgi:hypothetical protein